MFSTAARRISSLGSASSSYQMTRDVQQVRRARERGDRQRRQQEQSMARKRERRQSEHEVRGRDFCRHISAWLILPTIVIIILGSMMTLCSNIQSIGVGTEFWESSRRHMYRWLGPLVLLLGCAIMFVNYMMYKKVRTGKERTEPIQGGMGDVPERPKSEENDANDLQRKESCYLNVAYNASPKLNRHATRGPSGDEKGNVTASNNVSQNANEGTDQEDFSEQPDVEDLSQAQR